MSGNCANDLGGGKAKGQTIFPERKFKWQTLTRKEKYRIAGRPGGLEGGECNSQDGHYIMRRTVHPVLLASFATKAKALHN